MLWLPRSRSRAWYSGDDTYGRQLDATATDVRRTCAAATTSAGVIVPAPVIVATGSPAPYALRSHQKLTLCSITAFQWPVNGRQKYSTAPVMSTARAAGSEYGPTPKHR